MVRTSVCRINRNLYTSSARTRLKLKPGQRGTKKMVLKYGSKLVCVRYRYAEVTFKRYKTVELIEDEIPWRPKLKADTVVEVQVK